MKLAQHDADIDKVVELPRRRRRGLIEPLANQRHECIDALVSLTLEIPEDLLSTVQVDPERAFQELRLQMILELYSKGELSYSKARRLLGLTVWDFEDLLASRKVIRPFSVQDYQDDLKGINELFPKKLESAAVEP